MTDNRRPHLDERCPRGFPQELLSGHLDRELTQGDAQRVRVHLEDCATCRRLDQELRALREATLSTDFVHPPDDQWDETPRGRLSWLSHTGGVVLLAVWLLSVLLFTGWEIATGPEEPFVKWIFFTGLSGGVLLFVSALVDRLRTLGSDRYRGVRR